MLLRRIVQGTVYLHIYLNVTQLSVLMGFFFTLLFISFYPLQLKIFLDKLEEISRNNSDFKMFYSNEDQKIENAFPVRHGENF